MTPLVSILLPSLNRPKMMMEAIGSFYDKASKEHLFEILVLADTEDSETIHNARQLSRIGNVHVIVQHKFRTWLNLDRFFNLLAVAADGDFLWPFNDDGRILTQDWDLALVKACPLPNTTIALVHTRTASHGGALSFPLLTRALYRTIGKVSHSPHADCYLDGLAHCAGIKRMSEIEIWHASNERPPGIHAPAETWATYKGEECCREFERDKARLGLALGREMFKWTPKDAHDPTLG